MMPWIQIDKQNNYASYLSGPLDTYLHIFKNKEPIAIDILNNAMFIGSPELLALLREKFGWSNIRYQG